MTKERIPLLVGGAGVLIVIKTGAWLATDSVGILSSLIDSMRSR